MDIEDAFTNEAIDAADANVGGEEEAALREVIQVVFQRNEVMATPDHANIAVLCFIAGKTYQFHTGDEMKYTVKMNQEMVGEFMEFLLKKGES